MFKAKDILIAKLKNDQKHNIYNLDYILKIFSLTFTRSINQEFLILLMHFASTCAFFRKDISYFHTTLRKTINDVFTKTKV